MSTFILTNSHKGVSRSNEGIQAIDFIETVQHETIFNWVSATLIFNEIETSWNHSTEQVDVVDVLHFNILCHNHLSLSIQYKYYSRLDQYVNLFMRFYNRNLYLVPYYNR